MVNHKVITKCPYCGKYLLKDNSSYSYKYNDLVLNNYSHCDEFLASCIDFEYGKSIIMKYHIKKLMKIDLEIHNYFEENIHKNMTKTDFIRNFLKTRTDNLYKILGYELNNYLEDIVDKLNECYMNSSKLDKIVSFKKDELDKNKLESEYSDILW